MAAWFTFPSDDMHLERGCVTITNGDGVGAVPVGSWHLSNMIACNVKLLKHWTTNETQEALLEIQNSNKSLLFPFHYVLDHDQRCYFHGNLNQL